MARLKLPEPYDFEVSTERFRAFGPDLANLWHEGGLHRVVAGRELRIEPVAGGVLVEPLAPEQEPVVRKLLGDELDLEGFAGFAADGDATLARVVAALAGFRPPLAPDPFEALVGSITAQQVSMFAAFAIRTSRPPTTRRSASPSQRLARSGPNARKRSVESSNEYGSGRRRSGTRRVSPSRRPW